ncbi:MAG: 4Fe-4S binding protein [Methanomassiliicoccus sp.]|nr:4Fe-4S binding protein [Methanomassiliicoccus sp.]
MGVRTDIGSKIIRAGFKHRFVMARMTRLPLLGRAMDLAFFDQDEMIYLPKDSVVAASRTRSINIGAEIVPTNTALPSQVIDHFLRRSRYIFIMNKCTCRDSNGCEHYPHELGCIFLGAGTRKIPSKMGHMATVEEAIEHMRRARQAGLVHLIGRNKIDSVYLSTGPKEDLLSICNCCECCCLWKMMPDLSDPIASTVTRMPGARVAVGDGCTGCGRCVKDEVCFVHAIGLAEGKAAIDQERCKGCGRCVEHCPSKAIGLHLDSEDYIERSIRAIDPLVDLTKE